MKAVSWNPNKYDQTFEDIAIGRLVEAAEIVRDKAKSRCPVGTISRPMYKTGPYAGQPWTSRDAGRLKASIRITRKRTKTGRLSRKKNVRVYAGHTTAFYANIVEHYTPFLNPAFVSSYSEIKSIVGAK